MVVSYLTNSGQSIISFGAYNQRAPFCSNVCARFVPRALRLKREQGGLLVDAMMYLGAVFCGPAGSLNGHSPLDPCRSRHPRMIGTW